MPALREALAGYLSRARGVTTAAEQIVIVNGSQQALDLLARLLVDAGDRVVFDVGTISKVLSPAMRLASWWCRRGWWRRLAP